MDGALIVDKPAGITSHDVVLAVRRLLGEKRIGHLGTLDPFATGVLVLLTGRATRLARFYGEREKTYQGVIRFGFATDTMDSTGTHVSEDTMPAIHENEVRRVFAEFSGSRLQRPPAYSAKKISGVPAYRLARQGMRLELAPVPVVIHSLELLWVDGARAGFQARVSSGTYLRSLVHDLGEHMTIGAHLAELRRTALGEFNEHRALKLGELEASWRIGTLVLIPLEELLPEFPLLTLTEIQARRAGHGNDLELNATAQRVRMLSPEGRLIAIGEWVGGGFYHPVVVMVTGEKRTSGEVEEGHHGWREARVY